MESCDVYTLDQMMKDFVNGTLFTIKLDKKNLSEDGSIFYRFTMLDGRVVMWFSLHDNNHIYSIGLTTENLFPVSGTRLIAETDMDEPFYFKKIIIDPHTLDDDIPTTQKYIEELQVACVIGQAIENFFKNEFLQKYVKINDNANLN